jgi:hypothetical protein
MTIKAQARSKSKKSGATAEDRRVLEQAAREDGEGPPKSTQRSTKGPAAVLREQKAKIDEIHANSPPPPRMSTERHPASDAAEAAAKVLKEIGATPVPMTLDEICDVIGEDCHASNFASSALETLAGQVDALANVAEKEEVDPFEAFRLMRNVCERMRLASRVTAWLESETPLTSLPGVSP